MRKLLLTGVAALAFSAAAMPAFAAESTTNVTFSISAGALSISAPSSASLGSFGAGTGVTNVSGKLGSTTVSDLRSSLAGAYNVTATASNFTTGAGGLNETVLGANVTMFSGPSTHTNTSATLAVVDTTVGVPAAGVLPILTVTGYTGNDSASYNPTVAIPVPATNAAGTYAGTITQTVL